MKKYIIPLLITFLFNSCRPEPYDTEVEYSINNSSSHKVSLTFFNVYISDNNYKDTTFYLAQKANVKYHPPFGGTNDSCYIIFEEKKQVIYRRNDGKPRNILDMNSFTESKVSNYLYQYQYEITDDDYNNAVDIK